MLPPTMHAVAQPAQQVAGDRGGGALALGAGDAHDPRRGPPPGSHRPRPPGHRHARAASSADVGAVAADARGLDHDLAAGQRVQARRRRWRAPAARPPRPAAGRRPAPARAQGAQLAQVRQALDAEAPDADLAAAAGRGQASPGAQVRPGDRRAHRQSGTKWRPSGRSSSAGDADRLRGRPSGDLGRQHLEQRGAGAVGPLRGEQRRGAALVDLAHALERLGGRGAEQGAELVGRRSLGGCPSGSRRRQRLVPPKIRSSSAADTNGARIRSMKQHLSHGRTSGRAGAVCRCGRPGYSCGTCRGTGSARANRSATHSSLNGAQRGEVVAKPGPSAPASTSRKARLERRALGVLVVDRRPVALPASGSTRTTRWT